MSEIITDRLLLSALRAKDALKLFKYRRDPEVCRYQSFVPSSLLEAKEFIAKLQANTFDSPGTWVQLGIRLRKSGQLLGDIGVHTPPGDNRQAEIGFTVAASYQKRGIGTEAVKGIIGHLFNVLHKHRVYASVDPRNMPCMSLLKRVGMQKEAHFRKSLWFKNEWCDDVVFAILQTEWTN